MKTKDKYSSFISGKRIYLREVRPSDVTESYYCWMNDPQITKYTESHHYPNSKESLVKNTEEKQKNKNEIFLAIIVKNNNKHIGNIKLGPINWIDRIGDIGILVGEKDYWGKGYATEAINLIVEYAFNILGLHKLTAGSISLNEGSVKAFKNNNFEIEGIRKEHVFINGSYVDAIIFGLINK
ncbi:MAG: GNAT family N-acetyltransferase [Deltaproteobacteria bacterium]|nr:GNAT family N-acetyltransferase [Deltaproteobacteria bacterium]